MIMAALAVTSEYRFGTIRTTLLIGLAFIESLCIYALVIAFIAIGHAG